MWYRVQAGHVVEAGRREGHRPQDLPAALCAGPAAEGQPGHALPAPPACQRQARCQPAGLTCFVPAHNHNNNNLRAFQLIILARYLLGVPQP